MMSAVIRIDKTGALQIQPEKFPAQNLPAFKKGESLQALVLTAKGSQITLKTSDGRLFSANLLSGMELTDGANVELIVKENTGGHIILQLFAAEEGATRVRKPSFDLTQYKDNGKMNAVEQIFQQLNMKPTPAKVQNTLNIMKDYPSLNEKAAVFFTVNNIPVNEPNVAAVLQLTKENKGIGENLIEIIDALVEAEAKQANPELNAKIIGNVNDTVHDHEDMYIQKNAANHECDTVNKEIKGTVFNAKEGAVKFKTGDSSQHEKPVFESVTENNGKPVLDSGELSYIIKEAAVKPLIVKDEAGPVKTALWPQIETAKAAKAQKIADVKHIPLPDTTSWEASTAVKTISKILSMLANLDGSGADELKKVSSGTLEELNLIKDMVKQSDIKNKDDYVFKLSELISREKLTSDINRFICLHIPVVVNQSVRTAEVYIYRKNKKGKKIDKENTVIYLGLDMNFLGRIETVIQIEKKNVSLTFKLESEKAMSVVKDRTTKLFKDLQAAGYKLADTKILKLIKKTTVIDAEEELIKTVHKENVFIDYKI